MSNPLVFCSCVPRSGSTLLLNLLAQNPSIHVTPTNGLSEMVMKIRDGWTEELTFKSQGLKKVKPRILSALRGLMEGFYDAELHRDSEIDHIVIDKSRTWVGYIDLLEEIYEQRVQIIVPIRAVEEVLASFEKLHRKASLTVNTYQGPLHAIRQSTVGRAQSYLAPEAVLGMVIARIRDAIDRGYKDRLTFVPFREFTERPVEVVNRVTNVLGLELFEYDVNNVKQLTYEDDSFYGIELHKIREGKIQPAEANPWKGIFKDDFVNWIQQEYADINELARLKPKLKGHSNGSISFASR